MTYPTICLKAKLWKQRPDGCNGFYYPQNVTTKVGLLLELFPTTAKSTLSLAEFNGGKYIVTSAIPDKDIQVELIDMDTKRQLDMSLAYFSCQHDNIAISV